MTASEQNIEINRLQKEIEKYIALKQPQRQNSARCGNRKS